MEGTTTMAPAGRALDAATLTEALRRTAADHPEIVALRMPDDSVSLTWAEVRERVDALAGGLAGLGVRRGDCVALMLSNRPEFHIADLAAVTLGATPFSIYVTYPPAEIEFLMSDSQARVAIVEQAFLGAILEARANLPGLEHVIVVDGDAPAGVLALDEVEGADPDFDADAASPEVSPDDVLTLISTSGTTGHPKGVQLTHRAVMFTARKVRNSACGRRMGSGSPRPHTTAGWVSRSSEFPILTSRRQRQEPQPPSRWASSSRKQSSADPSSKWSVRKRKVSNRRHAPSARKGYPRLSFMPDITTSTMQFWIAKISPRLALASSGGYSIAANFRREPARCAAALTRRNLGSPTFDRK